MRNFLSHFGLAILFTLSSLSVSATERECQLPEKNICRMVKLKKKVINQKREEFKKLEELQARLMEAKAIRERLINKNSTREIENLEEDTINELALIAEGNERNAYEGVASLGGILLFSYLIHDLKRKGRKSLVGRLSVKMGTSHLAEFSRLILLRGGLGISIFTTFYVGHKFFRNYQKKIELKEVIEKLNQIQDQTENIITIQDELEEMDICFEIQLEELIERNLAKTKEEEIICQ